MSVLYFERNGLQSEEYPEDVRPRPATRSETRSPAVVDAQRGTQLGYVGASSRKEREVGG